MNFVIFSFGLWIMANTKNNEVHYCNYLPYRVTRKTKRVVFHRKTHNKHVLFIICLSDATSSGATSQMTIVFPCKVCGKIYARRSSMYNHLQCCGKERRFRCAICFKKFNYKHHLKKHYLSIHKKHIKC